MWNAISGLVYVWRQGCLFPQDSWVQSAPTNPTPQEKIWLLDFSPTNIFKPQVKTWNGAAMSTLGKGDQACHARVFLSCSCSIFRAAMSTQSPRREKSGVISGWAPVLLATTGKAQVEHAKETPCEAKHPVTSWGFYWILVDLLWLCSCL